MREGGTWRSEIKSSGTYPNHSVNTLSIAPFKLAGW
jgi:hypothetical protein